MPIPLPNLDDRSFADLVEEMRALIPRYAPEWTDHNLSDQGIMLIELFAYLTEALIYRLNRIPEASEKRFLELLGVKNIYDLDIDLARKQAIDALRNPWRAITAADIEQLIIQIYPQTQDGGCRIARVKCFPQRDLTPGNEKYHSPGHLSVVIVLDYRNEEKRSCKDNILKSVFDFLEERRLICCRYHVVAPQYRDFSIEARVLRIPRFLERQVEKNIGEKLKDFFHPLRGGPEPDKKGWPFGRAVYISEVYQVIEDTSGVDHVESVTLYASDSKPAGDRIQIQPWELVNLVNSKIIFLSSNSFGDKP
jgi:hypothetical protein